MPRSSLMALGPAALAIAVFALFAGAPATASNRPWNPYWNDLGARASTDTALDFPHRAYVVSLAALRDCLAAAPSGGAGVEITLPAPDGRLQRFRAIESPVLGPEMQKLLPDVKTYSARGLDDASAHARIDLTRMGVRAIVLTSEGMYAIDPLVRGNTDVVVSFWAKDGPGADEGFECSTVPTPGFEVVAARIESTLLESPRATPRTAAATGDTARSYRYVIVAPAEYTVYFGGDTLVAMAELVTAVNRINAAYERDAAIHLEAVWIKTWLDPATDPFDPTMSLLDQNQVVVDSLWGSANYDVAQVLHRAGNPGTHSGVGGVGTVCLDEAKAWSSVTAGTPTDLTTYRALMHELGHNFGALHSWDAPCNRTAPSAAEPYSGSTIMGRAGRCPPYDIQGQGDWYFHPISMAEIATFLATIPDCGMKTPTGSAVPTADAGPDYSIPYGTPFVLTGSGSDPDPADTLSYQWDQMDIAPLPFDLTLGPLFRSYLPSPSPMRYFPALLTVLSNTLVLWDRMPVGPRTLKFRLVVRGRPPGIGGVAYDDVTLTVAGAPFVMSAPNGGESIPAGTPFAVTWTVGGGTAAHVDLELSRDGGLSWSPLRVATPNDGTEIVALPPPAAATCRVRAKAVGNVYYDVSNADFAITGPVVDVDPVVREFGIALAPVAPNPSARDALVRFTLGAASDVDLIVISANGRLVRRLAAGAWDAGDHAIAWDGRDDAGRRVAAGAYVVRLEAGGRNASERIVRID